MVLHLLRVVQPLGRTITRQMVTIGHTTTDRPGDKVMININGAIHTKMLGTPTNGVVLLAVGILLQDPDLDGRIGTPMIEIKEITQQRVLHTKTSI